MSRKDESENTMKTATVDDITEHEQQTTFYKIDIQGKGLHGLFSSMTVAVCYALRYIQPTGLDWEVIAWAP